MNYAEQIAKPGWNPFELLRQQIDKRLNAPLTSSMGRLFDAAAALLGVRMVVNYEAQAAVELEFMVDPGEMGFYAFSLNDQVLDPAPMLKGMINDLRSGTTIPVIAARFHNSIADLMHRACLQIRSENDINEVALSGGVWQNKTLLERTFKKLEQDGFVIYLHSQVPANDGGISLGQAAIALHKLNL